MPDSGDNLINAYLQCTVTSVCCQIIWTGEYYFLLSNIFLLADWSLFWLISTYTFKIYVLYRDVIFPLIFWFIIGHVEGNGEETPYSICPRLKAFSDWLLKIMASGTLEAIFPAASREYVPLVEELCGSAAFQATYKRRNELEMLPSISSYFLEQARLFTICFS